jgi:hypothetical protein
MGIFSDSDMLRPVIPGRTRFLYKLVAYRAFYARLFQCEGYSSFQDRISFYTGAMAAFIPWFALGGQECNITRTLSPRTASPYKE